VAKRKKPIDPEDPLQELSRVFQRLDEDQGMVARRNARAAFFAELRRVRGWTDRTYPSTTKRKPKPKPKKPRSKITKLKREGWVVVHRVYAEELEAGVKPRTCREDKVGKKPGMKRILLPSWVVELRTHPKHSVVMLKKAKRDIGYRKEMVMENRLRKRRNARRELEKSP